MKTTTRSRWILDLHNSFCGLHCITSSILTCDLIMAQNRGRNMSPLQINKQNIYETSCVSSYLNLFVAQILKKITKDGEPNKLHKRSDSLYTALHNSIYFSWTPVFKGQQHISRHCRRYSEKNSVISSRSVIPWRQGVIYEINISKNTTTLSMEMPTHYRFMTLFCS
jgi:hypothetical protein